jgi:hypothetical protein
MGATQPPGHVELVSLPKTRFYPCGNSKLHFRGNPMSKFIKAVFIGAALSLATVSVAGAQATSAPAAAAAKFSADTPIETIAANPAAKAALDSVLGADLTKHPQYEAFKGLSPRALAPYSEGKITDAALKALDTALAAVKG